MKDEIKQIHRLQTWIEQAQSELEELRAEVIAGMNGEKSVKVGGVTVERVEILTMNQKLFHSADSRVKDWFVSEGICGANGEEFSLSSYNNLSGELKKHVDKYLVKNVSLNQIRLIK